MKRVKALPVVFLIALAASGQHTTDNKKEIRNVINTFMHCIVKKDSIVYYDLFFNGPVTWVGVFKDSTQRKREAKNNRVDGFFTSDYKEFYRGLSEELHNEEKFYNIQITEDGSVASVTFDYGFWTNGKLMNWGSEHWGMVKIQGSWKISSVIFSMELIEFVKPLASKERGK